MCWGVDLTQFSRIGKGGLVNADEACAWVDNPNGPLNKKYAQMTLANFDRECDDQPDAKAKVKASTLLPPFAGPSNWTPGFQDQPSHGMVPLGGYQWMPGPPAGPAAGGSGYNVGYPQGRRMGTEDIDDQRFGR